MCVNQGETPALGAGTGGLWEGCGGGGLAGAGSPSQDRATRVGRPPTTECPEEGTLDPIPSPPPPRAGRGWVLTPLTAVGPKANALPEEVRPGALFGSAVVARALSCDFFQVYGSN